MCKLHGYRYACGHLLSYRLSRCRGTYTKFRRRDNTKIAACLGQSYIELVSKSACGPCQYHEFNRTWDRRLQAAQTAYNQALTRCAVDMWGVDTADELQVAEDGEGAKEIQQCKKILDDLRMNFDAMSWKVRNLFPTAWRFAYPTLAINDRVIHASPLRREVTPEEVVLEADRRQRRQQQEREIGGDTIQYSTFQSFFMDKYSVYGPVLDVAAEANAIDEAFKQEDWSWPSEETSSEDSDMSDDPSQLYFTSNDGHDENQHYYEETATLAQGLEGSGEHTDTLAAYDRETTASALELGTPTANKASRAVTITQNSFLDPDLEPAPS